MADLDIDVPVENPMDIGSAIKQKLAESVKNMDVISLLQKVVAVNPEDEDSEEIRGKLQGVLDKYNQMSDPEKEYFSNQLKEMLSNKIAMRLNEHDFKLEGFEEKLSEAIMYNLLLLGVGALVVIALFVFFGYKLYKSIKAKEIKREEKKKLKQMKKKK